MEDSKASASENSPASGIVGSPSTTPRSGKSCKGYLYYSSVLKSRGNNPVCAGVSRRLPQVPDYIVGESEMEAMKQGRGLSNFRYACAGYSVFLDNKDKTNGKDETQTELPFCAGLELLVDMGTETAGHVHPHKDGATHPSRGYRPGKTAQEEFLNRFQRSAGLVASGVSKNLEKMARYVKESIDELLYRKRPRS